MTDQATTSNLVSSETNEEAPVLSPESLDRTLYIARTRYVAALNAFYANGKKMSARSIMRAVVSAIDIGVTNTKIEFIRKEEAELAGLLAQVIDLSLIIKADNLKQKEEKSNGKDTNKEE